MDKLFIDKFNIPDKLSIEIQIKVMWHVYESLFPSDSTGTFWPPDLTGIISIKDEWPEYPDLEITRDVSNWIVYVLCYYSSSMENLIELYRYISNNKLSKEEFFIQAYTHLYSGMSELRTEQILSQVKFFDNE